MVYFIYITKYIINGFTLGYNVSINVYILFLMGCKVFSISFLFGCNIPTLLPPNKIGAYKDR
jgi:hypothetical protein